MKLGTLLAAIAAAIATSVFALSVGAESFAGKPVKIIVGYSPGGGADLIARTYADKLQAILDTPVIVENKAGAFEQIAAQTVLASAPDGHTLWLGTTGALTMGPGVRTTVPYDVIKNFTPVGKIGEVDAVFTINNSIPANSMAEFVAYAKQNPNKLYYASAGVGSGNHLLTEYIMNLTGITMLHVPYKGDVDVVREVATGRAQFGIPTIATGAPWVQEGKLKALAVTGAERAKALPNVPSLAEDGGIEPLKAYGVYAIYALLGPVGMPPATTKTLNDAITKVSLMPDVRQKLEAANLRASASTSDELRQYLEREIARWKEVGKKVKID